ncbi:MAG: hypothetical protein WCG25_08980 [bacterium]
MTVIYLKLFANLRSPFVKYLISLIPYLIAVNLFIHGQKAKPLYSSGSTPAILSTLGCTIPAHNSSIHLDIDFSPVFLSNISYLASISKPGSTNGKNHGLILTSTFLFSITDKNFSITSLKFAILTHLSMYIHSN